MPNKSESLSSLFSPPEGLHGIGAVLCAYSADAAFLEQAILRFTRVPPASRISRGSLDWTLMLDPKHDVIPHDQVPGLLNLRAKAHDFRPLKFQCMHAKVALLAFGASRTGKPTLFKLIVSTGNWTLASAKNQIELVWFLDVHRNNNSEDRNELWAVAMFLKSLMFCYQGNSEYTSRAQSLISYAISSGEEPKNVTPQFLTTVPLQNVGSQSLISQLQEKLKKSAKGSNYLVCGSGFFEQMRDPLEQPTVLSMIDVGFQKDGILVKPSEKMVVSNADKSDQVIAAFMANNLKGWELSFPKDPVTSGDEARKKLHAKFLFVARANQNKLSKGWLYLGSGNLSIPGFIKALPAGNIEAGVLIPVPELDSTRKLKNTLPIGKQFKQIDLQPGLLDNTEQKVMDEDIPPAPVLFFKVLTGGQYLISWDKDVLVNGAIEIILPDSKRITIKHLQQKISLECSETRRCFEITWDGYSCKVPCLSADGEYVRQSVKYLSFDTLLDQLNGFPETWNDPEPDGEIDDGGEDLPNPPPALDSKNKKVQDLNSISRDFPAHTAMKLIETIAERNGEVTEEQAADWLNFLRHILLEQMSDLPIESWQGLRVNFMRALHSQRGFAPEWTQLDKYCELLTEVARAWNIHEFHPLELHS